MTKFDLDDAIVYFVNNDPHVTPWTLRHALEGVQIFGGIGSGKTSGSGQTLALKYLKYGFGGLVLTVKSDEVDTWKKYCQRTNRMQDLIILEPNGPYSFNFLQYESESSGGKEALTENIVEVLKTVIKASQEKDGGGSDNAFWANALDMLMFNVIDLCRLAYGKITVQLMYDIALSLPQPASERPPSSTAKDVEEKELTAFKKAHKLAHDKISKEVKAWHKGLTEDYKSKLDAETREQAILDSVPNARLFNSVNQFFFGTLKNLNEKTRSIIDFMFSGFLFRLLREPIYSTFCKHASNVVPEDCLEGKIIVLNLPVKIYNKVGRDCQILFKYIWQRHMEKRDVRQNERPVFLWADEAQNFIHEHDADYQATTRSSRISTVYLTQNLPNYFATLGGKHGEYKVKSFIGTLGTKIFHANADIETNKYASELVGDNYVLSTQEGIGSGETTTYSMSTSTILERTVRPESFVGLKNGGPRNELLVEGLVHIQGTPLFSKRNHKIISFYQGKF